MKIGGINYKIVYTELDEENGKTDFDKSLIQIGSKQNKEQQQATLIHEILHGVNNQLQEKDIEFLAQSLYQIYKDNKYELRKLFQ